MFKNILNSEFVRNAFILFSGSLISQLIPFIVLPILQRFFYSPSDFGILVVFISFVEIFSNVACLKLEYAIVLQNRLRDAINLAYGALRISWLISALSLVLVLIFKSRIANYIGVPKLENYLFLLPLYILLLAFNDVSSYWFNRKKNFKMLSIAKISQTSASETIKLSTGYFGFNFAGLILGKVFGYVLPSIIYFFKFYREDRNALKLISYKESKRLILKNKKFILYTTPSVFFSSAVNLIYLNLFMLYFGKDVVGMIGVSMMYLSAGFGVISVSISQVYYSRIAEINSREELLKSYVRFSKNLFLIAIIIVALVYAFPTRWVTYLLGSEWMELISIARIMVIWLAIWFVSSSLSFIFIRLGRQKEMIYFNLIQIGVICISFFSALWINPSYYSALWGFSIGQSLFYIFAIFIAVFYIKRFDYAKL